MVLLVWVDVCQSLSVSPSLTNVVCLINIRIQGMVTIWTLVFRCLCWCPRPLLKPISIFAFCTQQRPTDWAPGFYLFHFRLSLLQTIEISNKHQHHRFTFRNVVRFVCFARIEYVVVSWRFCAWFLRLVFKLTFWFCLWKSARTAATCIDFMWHTNCIHFTRAFQLCVCVWCLAIVQKVHRLFHRMRASKFGRLNSMIPWKTNLIIFRSLSLPL